MLLCVVMSMKFLSGVGVIQKHYSLPCITTTLKRGGEAVIYSLLRPSFFPSVYLSPTFSLSLSSLCLAI